MITYYHNPRCQKSREGLALLEESGKDFKLRKYLNERMSKDELEKVIYKLDIKPIELVRKNEALWKEKYADKKLADKTVISILLNNPKLIERPILVNGNRAVIGRPPSNINSLL
ncbi:arsenate reductase (glutaredoxin) [Croceiramulus getboli]|nr:arsenate reductase (glutaredoxin) [Flavobacteriaceae bacterium YJPT1-3]